MRMGHVLANDSFPPVNCQYFCIDNHSIFSFQSLNWPKSSNQWCSEGARVLGWEVLTVLTRQSIIPLSYTKCNTIDAPRRRHFLFSPQEFSQTKRRQPHPWCVDGVDAPGWGLVQPQAERFASTLGVGRRAVMLSCPLIFRLSLSFV